MAKLLLCHQFFWPDVAPYGSILRVIGEHWSSIGHEVEIFTTEPNEARRLTEANSQEPINLEIRRVTLPFTPKSNTLSEFLNALAYTFKLLWHIRSNRTYDLIMISTMPPVLAGIAGALASIIGKSNFIYHLMDIYPEAIQLDPNRKKSVLISFLMPMLKKIDNVACKRASAIVVLSDDMKRTLLSRQAVQETKIIVLPNFAVPSFEVEQPLDKFENSKETENTKISSNIRFVFAGNIGRFQGLHGLVPAFINSLKSGVNAELVFIGSGTELGLLKSLASNYTDSIHFTGQVSRSEADQAIAAADVCIVSLAPMVNSVSFPTKISSYLRAGKPLLGLSDSESSVAKLINENNLGIAASQTDQSQIEHAILSLCVPGAIESFQEAATVYGTRYKPEAMLNIWNKILIENISTSN